jgi:hypothetical protein
MTPLEILTADRDEWRSKAESRAEALTRAEAESKKWRGIVDHAKKLLDDAGFENIPPALKELEIQKAERDDAVAMRDKYCDDMMVIEAQNEKLQTEYARAVDEIIVLGESGDPLLAKGWTDILDQWKKIARGRMDRIGALKAVIRGVFDWFRTHETEHGELVDDFTSEDFKKLWDVIESMQADCETWSPPEDKKGDESP